MIEVLLVDDETYVTESLALTIPWQSMNVQQVHQAASAADALTLLERNNIDIVVTDIRMPEMSGLELIEKMTERWPHIRSILLTGYADFEYAKKAIQLQATDYLLKPVNDDDFIQSITKIVDSVKAEWERESEHHQMLYNMRSDRSVLKQSFLHDLALGRPMAEKAIVQKLAQYEIPLRLGSTSFLLLAQFGPSFAEMDDTSIALMEYAAGNIAEELFSNFYVWHSKAPHDCLMILASRKPDQEVSSNLSKRELEPVIAEFQEKVQTFLKGEMSLVVSEGFVFPDELSAAYRATLSAIFQMSHNLSSSVVYMEDMPHLNESAMKSIETLYKPPTLAHLLESKQWEAAKDKLQEVFASMESSPISREHLYEVFLSISNAFMYIAHKQGHYIHQIDPSGFDILLDRSTVISVDKLKSWSYYMLDKLETGLSATEKYSKRHIIQQVQTLVNEDLGQDTSVKTIADKVFLHPVYLSKLYKNETGESLGDYIIRMRMERALYLLKHTNKKIYEITSELGYQNPQYFSKMFKKVYGMTPNEYRD